MPDPRLVTGIESFNACAFFDAHEVWEALWLECHDEARPFYQGLIQVAVCLHHFWNGNTRGARKLCLSSCAYLAPFGPAYRGIDVRQLTEALRHCCAEILADESKFPRGKLDRGLIPKIQLGSVPAD